MTVVIPETRVRTMRTIEEIKQAAENHGSYWFSPDTLAAFRSEVDDETCVGDDGTYFVSSEQQSGDFWNGTGMDSIARAFGSTDAELEREHPREYNVRRATLTDDGFTIDTLSRELGGFDNRADAIEYARMAAYDTHECAVCGGELVPYDFKVPFIHKGQSWLDLDDADHTPVRDTNL